MLQLDPLEFKKQRRLAVLWGITLMILFPVLIILGLLMRMSQGDMSDLSPDTFYAYMTFHGLGMAGTLFSFSLAGLWFLNSTRIVRLNLKIGYFVYIAILLGVIGLAIGVFVGNFGPGWYMLYPLPFKGGSWSTWSTQISTVSLLILGASWLIGILHILYNLAKEFGGLSNLLGWQYLKKQEVKRELPPLVLITTISLIPGLFAFVTGAAMLIMYLLQTFEPTLNFDPLLMKNMVMFFGHTLVNITMYCCLGWVYTLLPEFTHREWKVNNVLVYSWNATFFFIVFAYFHHLYMDFAQASGLHYFGQVASYLSPIPATGITMFGVVAQIYHAKLKWSIVPLTFLMGTLGWAIGGLSAVVDSTIAINKVLHNTLWVPAHFHTYMLMGVVLFIIGFLFYLFSAKGNIKISKVAMAGFWTFVLGSYGFLLMFYLGGYHSIPRRFSSYSGVGIESTHSIGASLAKGGVHSIHLLLLGLFVMYVVLVYNLMKKSDADLEAEALSENS